MNLRIIGGRLRGKKLYSAPGTHTRPTADRVREAIFNILNTEVVGTKVLDMFAGTGCFGLEALSRGAERAVFIDNHRLPVSVIKKNIAACRFDAVARIHKCDFRYDANRLSIIGNGFDLVFMDPPYNQGLVESTLVLLGTKELLKKEAIVIVEHTSLEPIGESIKPFVVEDQRKYGKTLVSFLRYTI
jgi:16S rRNA (guanine966-N2)-methyltransferase